MANPKPGANDILMAGSLCKRTKFTKKWKKFYWRLLSSGLLCRYKDIKDTKSLGQVDIKRNCYDIREGLDASSKVTFPSYIASSCCFSILMTDKSYYVYADTPASAREWIRALSSMSGVISRRRSETDARLCELERRRIALRNTRQRRSRRNLPDTMSMDLVLECVEGELDHLEGMEDPYVTILPPSPSHITSQQSTASLRRRATSVPYLLNLDDSLSIPVNDTANGSMTSLYDESEAETPLKPTRITPPSPTRKSDFKGAAIDRRNSFSEDHPTLQRNSLLRETRRAHKGFFASPQVTSTTFKIGAVDDMQLHSCPAQDRPIHRSIINTEASPTQSESSIGIVNVMQQSIPISPLLHQHSSAANSSYNNSSPELHTKLNASGSAPVKRFASKQKVACQKSLPDCASSPAPNNSFVFPASMPIKNSLGTHRQSLPDFMAQVTTNDPMDVFSPPVVKRFTKSHQRHNSLQEFMPIASINDPANQKLLHKALGGTRPHSMATQQAVIAELQLASKLNT